MEISAFLEIGVIGVALSLVVEYIKTKATSDLDMRAVVLALSVVVGTGYWIVADTAYYQSVIGVLSAASTVYAIFLKR